MTTIIPINVDRNVSVKDYEHALTPEQILVHSTFYTFQGEGPFAGTPCVFLRLGGCNIGAKQDCPWCDTKFDFDGSTAMQQTELANKLVDELRARECYLIVVTGGEPLLQWQRLRPVMEMVNNLRGIFQPTWQFETNGLLLDEYKLAEAKAMECSTMFVVSPKIPHNKGVYRDIPVQWHTYHKMINLKYVVTADPASPYSKLPPIVNENVFVCYVSGMAVYKRSPMPGEIASIWTDDLIDRQSTARNYAYASYLALHKGLQVSFQTHLFGAVE